MNDDLVEVKLKDDYEGTKFVGICGFYISKGETKKCPEDVYEAGKDALELVDKPKEEVKTYVSKKGKGKKY